MNFSPLLMINSLSAYRPAQHRAVVYEIVREAYMSMLCFDRVIGSISLREMLRSVGCLCVMGEPSLRLPLDAFIDTNSRECFCTLRWKMSDSSIVCDFLRGSYAIWSDALLRSRQRLSPALVLT
jgi:hypothetical protein